jgi:hypothetical protein
MPEPHANHLLHALHERLAAAGVNATCWPVSDRGPHLTIRLRSGAPIRVFPSGHQLWSVRWHGTELVPDADVVGLLSTFGPTA